MKMRIYIGLENDGFNDGTYETYNGVEVARILRECADKVEDDGHITAGYECNLFDINGNKVGFAKIVPDFC